MDLPAPAKAPELHVLDGGRRVPLNTDALRELIESACSGLGADVMQVPSGQEAMIDGERGTLVVAPGEATRAAAQVREAERLLRYVADSPPGLVTPLAQAHLFRLRALTGIAGKSRDEMAKRIQTALEALEGSGQKRMIALLELAEINLGNL